MKIYIVPRTSREQGNTYFIHNTVLGFLKMILEVGKEKSSHIKNISSSNHRFYQQDLYNYTKYYF